MGLPYLQEQTLRSNLDAQRSIKCKRKMLPTLNYSLVPQQPGACCLSFCCAFTSEEDGGGGECLHRGAF